MLSLKGVIALKLGDAQQALNFADQALKVDPTIASALMVHAAERLSAQDPRGALSFINRASEKPENADDVVLQLFRMRVFDVMHDDKGVETVITNLLAHHPENDGFRTVAVQWYVQKGRKEDAETVLRTFADKNPDNVRAALALVQLVKEVEGTGAAKKELSSLIKTRKYTFPFELAMGELTFAEGDYVDAQRLLRELIERTNEAADRLRASVALAGIMVQRNELEEANQLINTVLAQDAKNVDALVVRAGISTSTGKVDDAITDLRAALNEAPQSALILQMLADNYERDGNPELAEEQYVKALNVEKFQPRVGLPYVQFLLRYGKTDQAERV